MNGKDEILVHLFEHNVDLKNRRIFLHNSIGEHEETAKNSAENIIKSLLYLDDGKNPIEFFMHTPGGSITEMWGIYDIMRSCKSKIYTIGFGEICSAGGLLLIAGDYRFATKNCLFMSHSMTIGDGETLKYKDMEDRMKMTKKEIDTWCETLAEHTSHTKDWWKKSATTAGELWFTAPEMLKHGIIDEIYK